MRGCGATTTRRMGMLDDVKAECREEYGRRCEELGLDMNRLGQQFKYGRHWFTVVGIRKSAARAESFEVDPSRSRVLWLDPEDRPAPQIVCERDDARMFRFRAVALFKWIDGHREVYYVPGRDGEVKTILRRPAVHEIKAREEALR